MSQSGVLQGITLKKGIYEINGNIIFNSCSFEDGITLKVNDLRQIIEEITGKRIGKIHIKDWDVLEYFGIDKKISYLKFWEEVWNRWTDIHPEEEYIGGKVGELKVLGQVDVVTASKGYTSEENRKKWLAKYHIPYSQFMATPYGEDKLSLDYNIWIFAFTPNT